MSVFCVSVFRCGLETTGNVETEIDVVRASSTRELPERRAERIGEIQLQGMTAGALLDPDTPLANVRIVTVQATRVIASDIARVREPQTTAETHKPGVVVVRVLVFFEPGVVVVALVAGDEVNSVCIADECRRGVEREPVAERAGNRDRNTRLIILAKVVQSFVGTGH